jgi:hypothetical protein
MKKVGIFYGHLEFITAIWYSLWSFGNLVAIWYISPRFSILNKEKSGNPALQAFSENICCGSTYVHRKTKIIPKIF